MVVAECEIVKFSVVEEDGWGIKNEDGSYSSPPSRWYDVAVWNEGLQQFAKYELHKGKKVAVTGRYDTNTYQGKDRDQILADDIGIIQFGTRTRKGEKPQEVVSAGAASKLDF